MVNMQHCDPQPLLHKKIRDKVSIGLHLDLSEEKSSRDFIKLMLHSL